MAKIKLALLSGGVSGEREVSLNTGKQILDSLNPNKYEVFQYDPKTDLGQFIKDAMAKKFKLVLPALHGPFGEDGKLQGLLDMIGMPYVFSNCLASALAMNKEKTKIVAEAAGLTTIPQLIINRLDEYNTADIIAKLSLPIVVKPVELGSSVGITIADGEKHLVKGIKDGFVHDNSLMLEKYIKGRELTVAVIGQGSEVKALPVIEIKPQVSKWFDYKAKYEVGGSEEICPAQIAETVRDQLQESAVKIYRAVGCKDLARADFIWDEDTQYYFLEINTIPGMTATSLAPQAAQVAGMEFGEFLDKLIGFNIK